MLEDLEPHEHGPIADRNDRATLVEELARDAALLRHQQSRRRHVPLDVGGVKCCPECCEPLDPHRLEAGICVECLEEEESRQRRGLL